MNEKLTLFRIYWQQGFGMNELIYLNEEKANIKYVELLEAFKKIQADSTTACNYDLVETLTMTEFETEDLTDNKFKQLWEELKEKILNKRKEYRATKAGTITRYGMGFLDALEYISEDFGDDGT